MSKHPEQELSDEVGGAPRPVTGREDPAADMATDAPSGVENVEDLARRAAKKAKKERKAEKKAAKKAGKATKSDKKKRKEDRKDKSAARPATPAAPAASAAPPADPALFKPLTLRTVTFRNRIFLPPMDTYSVFNQDGRPTPFHYQHYVSRALGGFGLIICESTAVAPEGRISPNDVGLWEDSQIDAWRWIVDDIRKAGAVAGVQLNHGGRKASTGSFSLGYINRTVPPEAGGWQTLAPSPIAFGSCDTPLEMTVDQIHGVVAQFRAAAQRALWAGFQVIEIHAAHGYLLSEFLDPLSNTRTDEYGGDLAGRSRILVEVVDAIREVWPDELPLFVRVSATDWSVEEGAWDLAQTTELAGILKRHGVDLIDVSTGGIISGVSIPAAPNYQVPFSTTVHQSAGIPTTAVGLITDPKQAEEIVASDKASAVEIGRAALREPYWPLRAAYELGLDKHTAPYAPQYIRGAWGTRR